MKKVVGASLNDNWILSNDFLTYVSMIGTGVNPLEVAQLIAQRIAVRGGRRYSPRSDCCKTRCTPSLTLKRALTTRVPSQKRNARAYLCSNPSLMFAFHLFLCVPSPFRVSFCSLSATWHHVHPGSSASLAHTHTFLFLRFFSSDETPICFSIQRNSCQTREYVNFRWLNRVVG